MNQYLRTIHVDELNDNFIQAIKLLYAGQRIDILVDVEGALSQLISDKNLIEYKDDGEAGREVKMAFSNGLGQQVVESALQFIGNKNAVRDFNEKSIQVIPESINEVVALPTKGELNQLIPTIDDLLVKIECEEVEWLLIIAFYQTLDGQNFFSSEIVRSKYMEYRKTESRRKNYNRTWMLAYELYFSQVKQNEFKINDNGQQHVKKLIYTDGNIANATPAGTRPKKANTKGVFKRKSEPKGSFQLVSDLNLFPKDKESIKSFYSKYKVGSAFERNLIFCYYLNKILLIESITQNHIYTCYKTVGERLPGNLYQSLIDTKNKKGWLNTTDINNIRVTVPGENYIEHDLAKD